MLQQARIELGEVSYLGHRHEEVQPRKLHHAFHHPFLVGPPHQAEVRIEQVMAQELLEPLGQLPLPGAQDLGDAYPGVVVADPPGYTPEELEGPHMSFPERLRAFPLEGHHKERIGVRQHHRQEMHLPQHPAHLHQRLPEIHLRLAGPMHQRHEHFLRLLLERPHGILHDCVLPREARLRQFLPDLFGGMPLLAVHLFVGRQDLLDLPQKRTDLGLHNRCRSLVARRHTVCQDLLQRLPVHPRPPQHLPLRDPLHQHLVPNL